MSAEDLFGVVPDRWWSGTLGGLCALGGGEIQTGPFGSQLHASDYVTDGIPTIMPVNIGDNRVVEAGIARITEHDATRLSRHRCIPGDIVYSRRGDVERRALIREHERGWLCGTGSLRVRVGDHADPTFVSLMLGHPRVRAWITQHAVGATMPNLNTAILSQVPVVLPPATEQRAIADVLGALDDKIESNRRLAEVVDQLVRAEADAWRNSVSGWVTSTFGEFTQVFGGATPRTTVADYWGGEHAWATPSDITRLGSLYLFATDRNITDAGLASCTAEMHPPGTIFMTSRATIGAFAVPQVSCATNQGFIVVRPVQDLHRWFLLDEMQRRVPEMLDRANGSTFLELSRGNFKQMTVEVPADSTEFAALHIALDALHARAARAASESRTLAELRDALLPELLSGRLRVPAAEELVESAT